MFALETDVPVSGRSFGVRASQYPFAQMEVGHSFFMPLMGGEDTINKVARRANSAINLAKKRFPEWKFASRRSEKDGVEGYRVHRVA